MIERDPPKSCIIVVVPGLGVVMICITKEGPMHARIEFLDPATELTIGIPAGITAKVKGRTLRPFKRAFHLDDTEHEELVLWYDDKPFENLGTVWDMLYPWFSPLGFDNAPLQAPPPPWETTVTKST